MSPAFQVHFDRSTKSHVMLKSRTIIAIGIPSFNDVTRIPRFQIVHVHVALGYYDHIARQINFLIKCNSTELYLVYLKLNETF